jgi:hypothetical protein
MSRFEGTIKQRSDGSWWASGLVITHRDGEVLDTALPPRAFPTEERATGWLHDLATAFAAKDRSVVVERLRRAPRLARLAARA